MDSIGEGEEGTGIASVLADSGQEGDVVAVCD